jgi:lactoylglutathione lyase
MACDCKNCGGRVKGLAHIGLLVSDIARSKAFYVEDLGFESAGDHQLPNCRISFVRAGSCVIELIQPDGDKGRKAGPFDHVAIEVEDIDTLVCKLIERNVLFETDHVVDIPQMGIRNIFLAGPDGERLEFCESARKA